MGLFDVFKKKNKDGYELNNDLTDEDIDVEASEDGADSVDEYMDEEIENYNEAEAELEETAAEPEEEAETAAEPEVKKGFFSKLVAGLDKTRKSIANSMNQVFSSFTKIDEELFEELEETLIMADIGVATTGKIIDALRERVKRERVTDVEDLRKMLIEEITLILEDGDDEAFEVKSPTVLLVIGVNGVGKTTTIGKLASIYKAQGKKVIIGAADTFRAAAIDQLEVWAKRSDIDIVKHQENSDPAAVVYDSVQSAKSKKADILICDTAGRLHNKKNLMEELRKIFKVIVREYPEANREVFLVLDSTTGQNALQQAKLFKEVADISGIVLTKLDGSAKGGIVIAIKSELKLPVRFIGVGEGINDLQPFVAKDFARAIFETRS